MITLAMLLFGFASTTLAQSRNDDMLKQRAREKVGQLCDYISFIGSKKKPLKTRLYYVKKAKLLFLNNAEHIYDQNHKLVKEAAIMQVSSIRRKTPQNRYVKDYLPNLANMKYPNVEIVSSDLAEMKVSNLLKIGDNLYVCTVYFYQYFIASSNEGRILYKDKTAKRVQVYIAVDDTEDGPEHIVCLGDVYVESTTPLED